VAVNIFADSGIEELAHRHLPEVVHAGTSFLELLYNFAMKIKFRNRLCPMREASVSVRVRSGYQSCPSIHSRYTVPVFRPAS
jgi:hypothetical protein